VAIDASTERRSAVVEARIHKRPNQWQVRNLNAPNRMYTAGGPPPWWTVRGDR